MEMMLQGLAPEKGSEPHRFIINMLAMEDEQPVVRSCEVQAKGMRQRTSFGADSSIEDVFESRVAARLRDCLSRLEGGRQVLSLPEFLIEVEGLILEGVHLMVRERENGERAVIIRFQALVGLVQRIFHPKLGLTDPLSGVSERLALEMLCDVGMPILDLCAAEEGGILHGMRDRAVLPKRVKENAGELRFRLELIKRFLMSLDRPPVAPAPMEERASAPQMRMLPH